MSDKFIAVSKLAPNYENWLRKVDSLVKIVDLYKLELTSAREIMRDAAGLLLTGGSDIHPARYGKNEYLKYCRDIDEKRDELELVAVEAAFGRQIPVLGLCRGLQLLNVALKGTLIPDIPEILKSAVPHSGKEDVYHRVNVRENSLLFQLTGVTTEIVNSSHHQSIDSLAKAFSPVAYAPDFVIEAIETEISYHPFCVGVQWHPERMDFSNPLSWKLGVKFLEAALGKEG